MEHSLTYPTFGSPDAVVALHTLEPLPPPDHPSLEGMRQLLREGDIALEGGAKQLVPLIGPQVAALGQEVVNLAEGLPDSIKDTALTTIAKGLIKYKQHLGAEPPNAPAMAASYLEQVRDVKSLAPSVRCSAMMYHSPEGIAHLLAYAAREYPFITPGIVSECISFDVSDPAKMVGLVAERMLHIRATYTSAQLSDRELKRICVAGKRLTLEDIMDRATARVAEQVVLEEGREEQRAAAAIVRQKKYQQDLANRRADRATRRAAKAGGLPAPEVRAIFIPAVTPFYASHHSCSEACI